MVSWDPSQSMFDDMIMNYSVRYQLTSGTGGSATVYSPSTSVTLQGLAPNAEYNVSVAGINSCGGTSTFTTTQFKFQGTVTPVYSLSGWFVLLMNAPYHCTNASCWVNVGVVNKLSSHWERLSVLSNRSWTIRPLCMGRVSQLQVQVYRSALLAHSHVIILKCTSTKSSW